MKQENFILSYLSRTRNLEASLMPRSNQMFLTCLDLEGVLVPEIWMNLAEKTGIEAFNLTTRDVADYDELMRKRLALLAVHNLTIDDFRDVVAGMEPLEGATEFLDWLHGRCTVIILSDTFVDYARPLFVKLHNPTVFCHSLIIDEHNRVRDYRLRQRDQKKKAVAAFKSLSFHVIAIGDSYNDLSMLEEAHTGIFFRPTSQIVKDYPNYLVSHTYGELKQKLSQIGLSGV